MPGKNNTGKIAKKRSNRKNAFIPSPVSRLIRVVDGSKQTSRSATKK